MGETQTIYVIARVWLIFPLVYLLALSCSDSPVPKNFQMGKANQAISATQEESSGEGSNASTFDIQISNEQLIVPVEKTSETPLAGEPGKTELPGFALYRTHCQSCHGDIATTNKRLRTAAQVQRSIEEDPAMQLIESLQALSPSEVSDISEALSVKKEQEDGARLTFAQTPLLGNRHYVASLLESAFTDPGTKDTEVHKIIQENIGHNASYFGGPCGINSGNCQSNRDASSAAVTLGRPLAARAGYLVKACGGIASAEGAVAKALGKAGLTLESSGSAANLRKAAELFLLGLDPGVGVIGLLEKLFETAATEFDSEAAWKMVVLNLCIGSDTGISFRAAQAESESKASLRLFDRCFAQLAQTKFDPESIFAGYQDADYEMGSRLYGTHCASCHQPLDQSDQRDRSSDQISAAINDIGSMNSIQALADLSPDEIEDISYALSTTTAGIQQTARSKLLKIREDVAQGTIKAVDGCMQVLNYADLTNGRNVGAKGALSTRILNNLHSLHSSWFRIKSFPLDSDLVIGWGTRSVLDPEQPALYFTAALLDDQFVFRDVLTTSANLTAIRSNMSPTSGGFGAERVKTETGAAIRMAFDPPYFAPRGELLGIRKDQDLDLKYSTLYYPKRATVGPVDGSIDVGATFGGGVMGTTAYLAMNSNAKLQFRADGGANTMREWSKSVFKDLLCRDLPALRIGDVERFVIGDSSVPFRNADGCTHCHASTDQLAGAIRGAKFQTVAGNGWVPNVGGYFLQIADPDPNAPSVAEAWSGMPKDDFADAPPYGVLYFRDHHGSLVEESYTGLEGLGNKLAELEGPYVCLAKRYYEYFTGIDVDIGDLGDESRATSESAMDIEHRNFVIEIGRGLMDHQNPKKTIRAIMSSKFYRDL